MNKLVKKYKDLLKTNTMTKVEINSMRKALGVCSSLSQNEKLEIMDAFHAQVDKRGGIKITAEHTAQGISFLKRTAFKSNGQPRETKYFPFGNRELEALRHFKEFRLVNLYPETNGMGNTLGYLAVWEVRGKNTRFEYHCGHWGSIQVVG